MGIRQIGGSGTDVSAIYIDRFTFTIAAEEEAAVPWLGTWAKRIAVTISGADSDVSHFPLPIFIDSTSGPGSADLTPIFDEVGANSKRIAITKSDAITQLYVEIEKWDSGSEVAVVWTSASGFTIPSGTSAAALYLYYDNAQSDNTSYVNTIGSGVATNVWDPDFVMVQHMDGSALDSTSNANHGTDGGTADVAGMVGQARDFELDDTDYISCGNDSSFDFTDALTLQTWVKYESLGDEYSPVIGKMYNSAGAAGSCWLLDKTESAEPRFVIGGSFLGEVEDLTMQTGQWYFLAGTWQDSDDARRMYLNDNTVMSNTVAATIRTSSNNTSIGAREYPNDTWTQPADAVIDEVRISKIARAQVWINYDYYSMQDLALTYGSVETL